MPNEIEPAANARKGRNPMLTWREHRAIKRLIAAGVKQTTIATAWDIHPQTVSDYANRPVQLPPEELE